MLKIRINVRYSILLLLLILLFNGCATKTTELQPTKVSNEQMEMYKQYSCTQISSSLTILEKRAERVARIQNEKSSSDKTLIAWGWVLYGVPYLFLDGNGKEKAEFESILGQKEALEDMMIQKNCIANAPTEFVISAPNKY